MRFRLLNGVDTTLAQMQGTLSFLPRSCDMISLADICKGQLVPKLVESIPAAIGRDDAKFSFLVPNYMRLDIPREGSCSKLALN